MSINNAHMHAHTDVCMYVSHDADANAHTLMPINKVHMRAHTLMHSHKYKEYGIIHSLPIRQLIRDSSFQRLKLY